jgi:hypothetical protein
MNEDKAMQVFGNVATEPVKKSAKASGKVYSEFRLAEGHKSMPGEVTWYSIRVMHDRELGLSKGDFVKVTGRLKTDYWVSREGKPTGGLLLIAFEASKIAKPTGTVAEQKAKEEVGAATPDKPIAVDLAWQD